MRHGHHHHGRHGRFGGEHCGIIDVYHHMVCRHRVEIEVWPARAELDFQDEWTANPINTQFRFDTTVYNSEQGCLWEVRDPSGNPGLGTIDESGLYRAPPKGTLANGTTEIIVATAREDRLRKAYAWVTLVGVGPEPVTPPSLDIGPSASISITGRAPTTPISTIATRCANSAPPYTTARPRSNGWSMARCRPRAARGSSIRRRPPAAQKS